MHHYFFIFVTLLATVAPRAAVAEINPIPERDPAIGLEGSGSPGGGASDACTITYYNFCGGWIWLFNDYEQGDRVGIVYDLAENCDGGEGHTCENIGSWWYWRYIAGGCYASTGHNIDYFLYDVDENDCLSESPLGSRSSRSGQRAPSPTSRQTTT